MAKKTGQRRPGFGMFMPAPEAELIPRSPTPSPPAPPADPEPSPDVWSEEEDEPQSWRAVDQADDSENLDFDERDEAEPRSGGAAQPRRGGAGDGGCLPMFFTLAVLAILVALVMTLPTPWRTSGTVPPVLYTAPAVLPTQTPGAPLRTVPPASPLPPDPGRPRPTATRALRGGPLPTTLFK